MSIATELYNKTSNTSACRLQSLPRTLRPLWFRTQWLPPKRHQSTEIERPYKFSAQLDGLHNFLTRAQYLGKSMYDPSELEVKETRQNFFESFPALLAHEMQDSPNLEVLAIHYDDMPSRPICAFNHKFQEDHIPCNICVQRLSKSDSNLGQWALSASELLTCTSLLSGF